MTTSPLQLALDTEIYNGNLHGTRQGTKRAGSLPPDINKRIASSRVVSSCSPLNLSENPDKRYTLIFMSSFENPKTYILELSFIKTLCKASRYFDTLFKSPFKESFNESVSIYEIESKQFELVAKYLLNENIGELISLPDFLEFMRATLYWQMDALHEQAKQTLLKTLESQWNETKENFALISIIQDFIAYIEETEMLLPAVLRFQGLYTASISCFSCLDEIEPARLLNVKLTNLSQISHAEFSNLIILCTNLEKLDISYCHNLVEESLQTLRSLTKLYKLKLVCCEGLRNFSLSLLNYLTQVQDLDMRGTFFLQKTKINYLAGVSSATSLKASLDNNIINRDVGELTKLTSLNTLELSGCNGLSVVGYSLLSNITALTALKIFRMPLLTKKEIIGIKRLTNLRKLTLGHCERLKVTSLRYLKPLTNLTYLDLSYFVLNDASCKYLTHLTGLRSLFLSKSYPYMALTDEGFSTLTLLTALTNLNLSHSTALSEHSVINFQSFPLLRSLSLSKCYSLAPSLLHHPEYFPSLRHIDLAECDLSNATIKKLADFISLKSVNLHHCTALKAGIEELPKRIKVQL